MNKKRTTKITVWWILYWATDKCMPYFISNLRTRINPQIPSQVSFTLEFISLQSWLPFRNQGLVLIPQTALMLLKLPGLPQQKRIASPRPHSFPRQPVTGAYQREVLIVQVSDRSYLFHRIYSVYLWHALQVVGQ